MAKLRYQLLNYVSKFSKKGEPSSPSTSERFSTSAGSGKSRSRFFSFGSRNGFEHLRTDEEREMDAERLCHILRTTGLVVICLCVVALPTPCGAAQFKALDAETAAAAMKNGVSSSSGVSGGAHATANLNSKGKQWRGGISKHFHSASGGKT